MSLKSELQDALANLKPSIDSTKALHELDEAAKSISNILAESYGLFWLEYLFENFVQGRPFLYSCDKSIQKGKLDTLIEYLYKSKNHGALREILSLYHQFFAHDQGLDDNLQAKFSTLRKIEGSKAIKSKDIVAGYCLKCFNATNQSFKLCHQCNSNDVLNISKLVILPVVKTILNNGQYLEIYVKQCLKATGIELIGYPTGTEDSKAFTNVRYQVDGDAIEVDVHGIATPLTLLLCEAKTSAKITPNELRRVEGLYDRLVDKINTLSGRNFSVLKLFVITGEFDGNISQSAYKRKGWELIDRTSTEKLGKVLKEIQSEL